MSRRIDEASLERFAVVSARSRDWSARRHCRGRTRVSGLDLELQTRAFLAQSKLLDRVQRHLAAHAAAWAKRLRIVRDEGNPRDSIAIDVAAPAALYKAVADEVLRPAGKVYNDLVQAFGEGPSHRVNRSLWLEGADSSLAVGIDVDEYPVAQARQEHRLGNVLTFQVRAARVGNVPASDWITDAVISLAAPISADYGFAATPEEFSAKNMDRSRGARAIGRDITRCLPGLYWAQYFGPVYVSLITKQRLLSAPAWRVIEVGGGVFVVVYERPDQWQAAGETSAAVLEHLGREFFFDRSAPGRPTRAPLFEME